MDPRLTNQVYGGIGERKGVHIALYGPDPGGQVTDPDIFLANLQHPRQNIQKPYLKSGDLGQGQTQIASSASHINAYTFIYSSALPDLPGYQGIGRGEHLPGDLVEGLHIHGHAAYPYFLREWANSSFKSSSESS